MLRILLLLALVTSCASERTKYGKYSKKEGGYQEKVLDDNLRVVSFKANSFTKTDLAKKFAQFRAAEICLAENFKFSHIFGVFDKTESKTVTRHSSSGYPSYYYGMSPFYGRYSGFGFGFSTMHSDSWNETLKYPDIEVIFQCANEAYEPLTVFREVPADEMKHLVKDLRGALQVEKIPKEVGPSDLKVGDILIITEGERIQQQYQLLSHVNKSKSHSVRVEVLRDGKTLQGLVLKAQDVSPQVLEGQSGVIQAVCKKEEMKEHKLCRP